MARLSAPSPVMPLNPTLCKMGVECKRQRVLTAGIEGWGGVLKGGEGPVIGETPGDVLCALSSEFIVPEPANESQIQTSGGADGADSRHRGVGRRTQGR